MLAKTNTISGSLGRRIFFLLAGISASAFLLANFIWLPSEIREIQEAQAELRHVSLQLIRDQVQGYLEAKETNLKIAAQRFRPSLLGGKLDREALRLTAQLFLQNESAFEEVGILDGNGNEIYRLSRRVAINDNDLVDRSNSALFREGVKREISWGPVTINETSEPLGVFSYRFSGSAPFLNGLVFGVINLRSIWDISREFRLGHEGQVYIVDEQGRLIASADQSAVLRQLSFADRPLIQHLIDPRRSGVHLFEESEYINERGVKTLATGLLLERPRWGIVIAQPQSILFTPILNKIWFFLGLSLLGLILSVITAQMFSRRLIRPILHLREGAKQIGDGNLQYKVSIETNDEIGELAMQFNNMAERLNTALEATLSALTIPIISQTSEVQDVLSDVLTRVMGVTDAKSALIRLIDDKKEEIIFSVYQGFSDAYIKESQKNVNKEASWETVKSLTNMSVSEELLNNSKSQDVMLIREGFASVVYVPLRNPQKTFGIMILASREPGLLGMKTNLCNAIAHEITVALENVWLYQEAVASKEELEKLNTSLNQRTAELVSTNASLEIEITQRKRAEEIAKSRLRIASAAGTKNSRELMQLALDEMEALTGSLIGFYHFLMEDQVTLSLQTWSSNTLKNMCSAEGSGSHYPVSKAGVWGDSVHERRPVIHNDYISLLNRKGMPSGHAVVIRELVVPIFRNARIVAIVGVGNKVTDYNDDDIDIITILGDYSWEIAERKRLEDEKRSLQDRLQRSEKMELLGTMAGGVAHDLNNVLGVLSGYSEILVEQLPEGNHLKQYATSILKSSEKGATIIQDLLTLARRGVVVDSVVDMNSIISSYLESPAYETLEAHHPQVTIKTDLAKDLLNIKGSPVHLEKTIMNLVSNAAEAFAGNNGEVQIRTENRYVDQAISGYDRVEAGDYAVLVVSDTGGGISASDLDKIFEPFYTKKIMGRSGTGLGLAIVWGTVKDHNGYIDVQSIEGEGTTFTLYFPVTREEMAEVVQKVPVEQYLGHGESVLVVDDVQEQRQVAATILTQLSYQVSAVSSGEEAVEYLKINEMDIIVLDMIMDPGIDGLDTYKRILDINPHQKVILVSGFSATERLREALRLGAGAYVKKPYLKEKIGVAIRDELSRK